MLEEILMIVRGLIFDINGTLIDIHTNEGYDEIYRVISNLLDYQGVSLSRDAVKNLYFQLNKEQRRKSNEEHPDFDVVGIFGNYLMAAVSDGQSSWAVPELRAAGLRDYFNPVVVSGDLGFRKPDKRIVETVLAEMALAPSEVLFIGNDMYRDVFGAHQLGMKTVFFKSNQGDQDKAGVEADYIIYNFSELPGAIRFFEKG